MREKEKQRIVVIGGGTGTHTILQGLKRYAEQVELAAIVTMADSGGSSGRIRDEFGFLPVGDARMALVALARELDADDEVLRKLFLYRFDRGEGLTGHTFGNLFLVALTDILGNEEAAIRAASRVLATVGEVIPVTQDKAHLTAHYEDGAVITGEHEIDAALGRENTASITKLSLTPKAVASIHALRAIHEATLIILGPGDLYTSILANCVVEGIGGALKRTPAPLVYISNLMSRRGQTKGMGTKEHIEEIARYIDRTPDYIFVNTTPFREDLLSLYAQEDEYPVEHNYEGERNILIEDDFLATDDIIREKGDVLRRSLIRHDANKLARAIMRLI